jgi:hypothetical protein
MPDCTDLKAEMAACWKVSWNDDPLALSVPLRLAELLDEPPAGAELEPAVEELLLDEEHAPRTSARATTETPAAEACFLYRSCIFSTPQFSFSGRYECSLGRPVIGKTVCARPVWPRWRYLRGNGIWIRGGWKVKFWCPRPQGERN